MTSPVAYIRRSVARTGDPGDISREFQIERVRALANGDGPSLRILDGDWGRSAGRHHADARAAFLAMIEAINRGEVSTVYAYSTDRLARDAEAAYGLLNACERAGATIVTSEGRFPPGDRMARTMFGFQAMQNEAALDGMSDKSSAVATKRKERGDAMGRAPYGYRHVIRDGVSTLVPREGEDPGAVVDAFLAEGSYNAAAKVLNASGLATRFGKSWDASTVRHVVQRWDREHGTANAPLVKHRGSPARKASARMFSRLLRCPYADHHPARPFLTVGTAPAYTNAAGERKDYGRYYCAVAHVSPTGTGPGQHPRPYIVAESKVLAWAKAAVKAVPKALRMETDPKTATVATEVVALETRRSNVENGVAAGVIRPERAKVMLAEIEADVAALGMTRRAVSVLSALPVYDKGEGPIDWTAEPGEINFALRALWDHVELDPATFEPVRAIWQDGKAPPYDER